jgi:hypothetical protein
MPGLAWPRIATMNAGASEMAAKEQRQPNVIGNALAVAAALWCAVVLYVLVSVSVLGVMYPLGRSAVATLFYGLLGMHPYFPHRGKLDLPIGLIHGFGLYKACQWMWRYRRSARVLGTAHE